MTRKRLLRYAAVVFGALALVQGVRTWEGSQRAVKIVYQAPPGPLNVVITDAANHRISRVFFGDGVERNHALKLTDGQYSAQLTLAGYERHRSFEVEVDRTIEIKWAR